MHSCPTSSASRPASTTAGRSNWTSCVTTCQNSDVWNVIDCTHSTGLIRCKKRDWSFGLRLPLSYSCCCFLCVPRSSVPGESYRKGWHLFLLKHVSSSSELPTMSRRRPTAARSVLTCPGLLTSPVRTYCCWGEPSRVTPLLFEWGSAVANSQFSRVYQPAPKYIFTSYCICTPQVGIPLSYEPGTFVSLLGLNPGEKSVGLARRGSPCPLNLIQRYGSKGIRRVLRLTLTLFYKGGIYNTNTNININII